MRTERGIPRPRASNPASPAEAKIPSGPMFQPADAGVSPPPRSFYVNGREELVLGAILAERKVGRQTEYLVRWAGYRNNENTWEPRKHLEKTQVLANWEKLAPERREALSRRHLDAGAQPAEPANPQHVVVDEGLQGAGPSLRDIERRKSECKVRTVRNTAL